MVVRLYRTTLLAAYQLSVLAGIALLPVAIGARKLGLDVPLDRWLRRLDSAYDDAAE